MERQATYRWTQEVTSLYLTIVLVILSPEPVACVIIFDEMSLSFKNLLTFLGEFKDIKGERDIPTDGKDLKTGGGGGV